MKHFFSLFFIRRFIVFFLLVFVFSFVVPYGAHAVVFESGIPGVAAQGAPLPSVTKYVSYLYVFVLGMVGIAGFISLVVWGTVWAASGIVDRKAMALESIKNTFIGIGIALVAYVILYTINPDLTVIKTPYTAPIKSASPVACNTLTKIDTCTLTAGCDWCSSKNTCIAATAPCP